MQRINTDDKLQVHKGELMSMRRDSASVLRMFYPAILTRLHLVRTLNGKGASRGLWGCARGRAI